MGAQKSYRQLTLTLQMSGNFSPDCRVLAQALRIASPATEFVRSTWERCSGTHSITHPTTKVTASAAMLAPNPSAADSPLPRA